MPATWLTPIRVAWLLTALGCLLLLIPQAQATFAAARHVCAGESLINCPTGQLTARTLRALHHIGMSADGYAAYSVVLMVTYSVVAYAIAVALMARRSRERMVLVAAFACVLSSISGLQEPGAWAPALSALSHAGCLFLLTCFSLADFGEMREKDRFVTLSGR